MKEKEFQRLMDEVVLFPLVFGYTIIARYVRIRFRGRGPWLHPCLLDGVLAFKPLARVLIPNTERSEITYDCKPGWYHNITHSSVKTQCQDNATSFFLNPEPSSFCSAECLNHDHCADKPDGRIFCDRTKNLCVQCPDDVDCNSLSALNR